MGAFKRMMGSRHQIKIGKQLFTATELSASFVLRSLKEDAETYLGEPVSEAVISVPAYFSDNQRQATKQAAEIAGLKVMRLINEPTAAAIAYGLNDKQQGTYMILDMGGGTFDVSILEFFDGVMQVHASAGDNFLGGEDFVDAMYEAIVKDLNIDKTAVPAHLEQRILMQLETAKRRVSSEQSQILALDFGSTQCEFNVTPVWFQEVVNPLLLRVKVPVERALRDANQTPSELDDVVLVGGATRMGVFRNAIGRMFGVIPSCHLDPDLVVAMGAAIQAGLIERNEALEDIVLTDVCPYTLGTGVINNVNPAGSGRVFTDYRAQYHSTYQY
ncbi:MAG: Hsp70 family protein [Rheinheimera sp.]|nr:Hsp70 family protein [Rheinheimera sp.]